MPSIPKDVDTLLKNSEAFFRHLPIKNICVVGPESLSKINDSRLTFINENEFVDVQKIKALYASRTGKEDSHVGWYVQQFIKLNYSRFTNDDYYLIWDSDTVPVRDITLQTRTPPNNLTSILRLIITNHISELSAKFFQVSAKKFKAHS